jgi:uncharacterized protein (DUF2236 family)
VPLPDDDADRYVEEQVAFAQLVGVPLETLPRSVAGLDAYLEGIRPSLALTPAAQQGVRDLFLPPMKNWVQVLTPARPAWVTLASLGFATLPRWARRMYSLPGIGITDAAATTTLRALRTALLAVPERVRWSPIVRAGWDRVAAEEGLSA